MDQLTSIILEEENFNIHHFIRSEESSSKQIPYAPFIFSEKEEVYSDFISRVKQTLTALKGRAANIPYVYNHKAIIKMTSEKEILNIVNSRYKENLNDFLSLSDDSIVSVFEKSVLGKEFKFGLIKSEKRLVPESFKGYLIDYVFYAEEHYYYLVRKPHTAIYNKIRISEVSDNQSLSEYFKVLNENMTIPDIRPEIFWDKDSVLYLAKDNDNTPIGILRLVPKRNINLPVEYGCDKLIPTDDSYVEISHLISDKYYRNSVKLTLSLFSVVLFECIRKNFRNLLICIKKHHISLYRRLGFELLSNQIKFEGYDEEYFLMCLNVKNVLLNPETKFQKKIIMNVLDNHSNAFNLLHDEIFNTSELYRKTFHDDIIDTLKKHNIETKDHILEIPTFTGNLTKSLLQHANVTSIDINNDNANSIREKCQNNTAYQLNTLSYDLNKAFKLEKEKYDICVLTNILYVLNDIDKLIQSIHFAMKKDAYLIVTDLNEQTLIQHCPKKRYLENNSNSTELNELLLWKKYNDLLNTFFNVESIPTMKDVLECLKKEFEIIHTEEVFWKFGYRIIAKK